MSVKRSAILGLGMALLLTLGMAEYSGAHVSRGPTKVQSAGTFAVTDDAALFPELSGEARDGVQVAVNGASLAGMLARTTLMSQVDCTLIYLDFEGSPRSGTTPLTVTFTDRSIVPAQYGAVQLIEWFPEGFDVGAPADGFIQNVQNGETSFTHVYTDSDTVFDVGFRILVNGDWCPARTTPNGTVAAPFLKPGYVVTGAETPTATLDFVELTRDQEGLVPLCDWVPLWNFTLGYDVDEDQGPALRYVSELIYNIRADTRSYASDPAVPYVNRGGPAQVDILEFGLFRENDNPDENIKLDEVSDSLIITWDSFGNDRKSRVDVDVQGTPSIDGTLRSPLLYTVRFLGPDNQPLNPVSPVEAGPVLEDANLPGNSYILAVRTSATWQSGSTLACDLLSCRIVDVVTGLEPRDDEGELLDSVPEFPLESEIGYSSSFSVWDTTGTPGGPWIPVFHDAWNRPRFGYTPTAEWIRPRWNLADLTLETVGGSIIDLRRLNALEDWNTVVGINLHSTKSLHFDGYEDETQFTGQSTVIRQEGLDKDAAQLSEVNLVVTDIGADPASPESAGLDPQDAFDDVVDMVNVYDLTNARGNDLTFNGIWVWHDSNNNGEFDPPTPTGNGVTFNGDFPLFPMSFFAFDGPNGEWEYVPYPPGGGDPWWKTKLRFLEGHRRSDDAVGEEDDVAGYVEKIPEGEEYSQVTVDYFVTVRLDSGRMDSSTLVGDGVGAPAGVDFRVFVEPRRFNPVTGTQDGGIYVSSMIPGIGFRDGATDLLEPWQDDPRWFVDEPWWNQRSVNAQSSKPLRSTLEVHDLSLLYESHSPYSYVTDFIYGTQLRLSDSLSNGGVLRPDADGLSAFERWTDPYGLEQAKFYHGYSVDIGRWYANISYTYNGLGFVFTDGASVGMFPYEIAPFLSSDDFASGGPRSSLYPNPPLQPTLPDYMTWIPNTGPNRYPRISDWLPADRQTRILAQRADIESDHVAMLGVNLAGASDPHINEEPIRLNQITVAIWGPEFTITDLMPLDNDGTNLSSGLILWEDSDSNGVFIGSPLPDVLPQGLYSFDQPVLLRNLAWPASPELVDLDGDGEPDDMDGDGAVDSRDRAWVLKLVTEQLWELPYNDYSSVRFRIDDDKGGAKNGDLVQAKALEPELEHAGDDLFISLRFSDKASRFERVRMVIPATLPERAGSARRAGIQFFPEVKTTPDAFVKVNPDEDPVQDFYGHDTMQLNVPAKVLVFGSPFDSIYPGGPAKPVLGIDAATNRPEGTLASGGAGQGGPKTFVVANAGWTPGGFAGDYLIDEGYEPYEITANTADTLTLRSGEPRSGRWRIVGDPTFLEQVVIEFYPSEAELAALTEAKQGGSGFNVEDDLLPLDIDQEISGVAIYRDNDMNPANRNGVWDPGVDIPISLDAEPDFIGQAGEPTQVRFVFSTPGTDNFPVPQAEQPRRRQWVQDTFGGTTAHPDTGADFFIVVRPSSQMDVGDAFRAGLVSWGPSTPSAPDPDSWTTAWGAPGASLPAEQRNEFVKFSDFPWAEHGLSFVTMLKTPQVTYFMEGAVARAELDGSGVGFVRSATAKKARSNLFEAKKQPIGPQSLVIDDTAPVNGLGFTELPSQILPGQVAGFSILGRGFGSSPQVALGGYDVTVTSASDTRIDVTVTVSAGTVPQEPLVLIVRNRVTGNEASRNDLFKLVSGTVAPRPVITGLSPAKAAQNDFPIAVLGFNFDAVGGVEVRFGRTLMPVESVSATRIQVSFPPGGLPTSGLLDVSVKNVASGLEGVATGAFEYTNPAVRPTLVCGAVQGDVAGGRTLAADGLLALAILAALGFMALRVRWRAVAGGR